MTRIRHPGATVVALLTWVVSAAPSSSAQPIPSHTLDHLVARAMKIWEVPGVALAVVEQDRVVLARGFGQLRLGGEARVDENTVFAVASNTKGFTAALLGTLVSEGRIGWDDRVIEHIPSLRLSDPWMTRDLRVRDLLTHRSGLPTFGGDQLWIGSTLSSAQILSRLRFLQPTAPLRYRFQYQNLMYMVAGELIPAVTGVSWARLLRERLLDPLGMTRTTTSIHDLDALTNVASPHEVVGGTLVPIAYDDVDSIAAAAAINASVLDMTRWMRLQLGRGIFEEKALLRPAVMREMHTLQMPVPISPSRQRRLGTTFAGYGLGWSLSQERGVKMIAHGGGLSGMISLQTLVPERDIGIIVLTNKAPNSLCQAVTQEILDSYLDGPDRDWIAVYKSRDERIAERDAERERRLAARRLVSTSPSLPLGDYAGRYHDDLSGDVELRLEEERLYLDYNPRFRGALEHWHLDTFRITWEHPIFDMAPRSFVTFSIDADATVSGFTVDFYQPIHFEKTDSGAGDDR